MIPIFGGDSADLHWGTQKGPVGKVANTFVRKQTMFRITIKINAREKPDYEQIHAILESRGFSTRHRKGSRTMCYSYGGDLTMEAVFELVTGIVSRLYKQFFVFVHEVDGRRGIGMAG